MADALDSPSARILAILAAVARLHAASVTVLAERLGLPVATAHRICSELERLGYLQRVPGTRLWTVAHRLVGLAADALSAAVGSLATNAILRELTEKVGEVSSFAVQSGEEVLYVASVESPHALTLSFRAGRRAPLFCTSSGRLFLARLDDQNVSRYLRAARRPSFTRHTVTDPRRLLSIVRGVRQQGYAVTSQEYVLHVVGAAVPVIGKDGTFFGAVSIAAPAVRTGKAQMRRLLPALKNAATRLAEALSPQAPAPATSPRARNRPLLLTPSHEDIR
ncbi:MAG TPA: IclR family transcriptional regulator [Casimicrobiaceae bacterium]|nr:IclR family transcriptional regulator [Casimicrobiaceae bacterium]